jgi:site-specific DNA recombinase
MMTGIYCRISQDSEGDELGVNRQLADCTAEAERRGWTVADAYTYIDNDTSASNGRVRPHYQRMLRDAAAGYIQAITVYDVSRLTRSPMELESIIDLADKLGLELATVGGKVDLASPEGRVTARIVGSFARYEVEQMGKRLKRKFADKAARGEPHGYSPYGYQRVQPVDSDGSPNGMGHDVIHPVHGEVVREAARRVLERESLRSIVKDFNTRGIHGPKAVQWNSTILRQILLRPVNAGLRQYQGKIVGPSTTQPLYSEDTYNRLVALLTDASRKSNHVGPGYKYLLSGLAICGLCGGSMRRQIGRATTSKRTGRTKRQPPSYNCSVCFKVRRAQASVDLVVESVLIERLERPDAERLFTTSDVAAALEAQTTIDGLDAKSAMIADLFTADQLDVAQFKRMNADLRERRMRASRQLESARPRSVLTDLVGGDVQGKWRALPIEAQREALSGIVRVTILPSSSGARFDPKLIQFVWKDDES